MKHALISLSFVLLFVCTAHANDLTESSRSRSELLRLAESVAAGSTSNSNSRKALRAVARELRSLRGESRLVCLSELEPVTWEALLTRASRGLRRVRFSRRIRDRKRRKRVLARNLERSLGLVNEAEDALCPPETLTLVDSDPRHETILENNEMGATVGITIEVQNQSRFESISLMLDEISAQNFELDGESGVISAKTSFDHEEASEYQITVHGQAEGAVDSELILNVAVEDIPRPTVQINFPAAEFATNGAFLVNGIVESEEPAQVRLSGETVSEEQTAQEDGSFVFDTVDVSSGLGITELALTAEDRGEVGEPFVLRIDSRADFEWRHLIFDPGSNELLGYDRLSNRIYAVEGGDAAPVPLTEPLEEGALPIISVTDLELDSDNDRLLVLASDGGLFSIGLTTFSVEEVVPAPVFDPLDLTTLIFYDSFTLNPFTNSVIFHAQVFFPAFSDVYVEVSLDTMTERRFGDGILDTGSAIQEPSDITFSFATPATVYLAHGGATEGVVGIDIATGVESDFSRGPIGSGVEIGELSDMKVVEETGDLIFPTQESPELTGIFSVRISDGDRAKVSGVDRGAGPLFVPNVISNVSTVRPFFVAEFNMDHILSVDIDSGDRSYFYRRGIAEGFPFRARTFSDLSPDGDRLIVTDASTIDVIASVSTTEGERTPLYFSAGESPLPELPFQLVHRDNGSVVYGRNASGFVSVDLSDGRTDLLASVTNARDLAIDREGGRLFTVVGGFNRTFVHNMDTGVSETLVATGEINRRADFITYGSDTLFITDQGGDQILVQPLSTNDRTILSSAAVGTGPTFDELFNVRFSEARGDLLAVDTGLMAVLAVDPVTGNRSVISSPDVGRGPQLDSLWSAFSGPDPSIVYAATSTALYKIDVASGDRVIISR